MLGDRGTFTRLDDETNLQAALADPVGLASYGRPPRAFDEIQRAGDPLVRAIKAVVDDDPTPGQYLLNGSADFLTVPTISESLAGRAVFMEQWPFTQGELETAPDRFLERAFSDPDSLLNQDSPAISSGSYTERICRGGFPEPATMTGRARRDWFANYVRTVTQRDITEMTGARRAPQLPKILSLLAARTSGELVVAHIHDESGLGSRHTTDDYIAYLEMTYLVKLLPAWSRNLTRKVTRHPKIHITDTGLAAHLLGKDATAINRPTDPARGPLHETFVINELIRQTTWADQDFRLRHLRDRDGAEIDIVAEASDGRVVAIEVKASTTVNRADAKWLKWLRDRLGPDFVVGVVLYTGERPFRLGDRLFAIPIHQVWTTE